MKYQFISFIAFGNRFSFDLRVVAIGSCGRHPHAGFEIEIKKGFDSHDLSVGVIEMIEKSLSTLCADLRSQGLSSAASHIESILYHAGFEECVKARVMNIIGSFTAIREHWFDIE